MTLQPLSLPLKNKTIATSRFLILPPQGSAVCKLGSSLQTDFDKILGGSPAGRRGLPGPGADQAAGRHLHGHGRQRRQGRRPAILNAFGLVRRSKVGRYGCLPPEAAVVTGRRASTRRRCRGGAI